MCWVFLGLGSKITENELDMSNPSTNDNIYMSLTNTSHDIKIPFFDPTYRNFMYHCKISTLKLANFKLQLQVSLTIELKDPVHRSKSDICTKVQPNYILKGNLNYSQNTERI